MDFSNIGHGDVDTLISKGLIQPETADLLKSKLGPAPNASVAPPAPTDGLPPMVDHSVPPAPAPASGLGPLAPPPVQTPVPGPNAAPEWKPAPYVNAAPATEFGHGAAPGIDPSQVIGAPAVQPSPVAAKGDIMENRMATMEKGFDQSEAAIKQGAAEGAKIAAAQAGYLDGLAKKTEERAAQNQAREHERQDYVKTEMTKMNALNDEVSKTAAINPNHYWDNQTTGGKISAGIAMVLGGFAGGLTGRGGNAAMDVINSAIQRDFEAQKANYQKAQNKFSNQANLVGMMRSNFGDERAADAAAMAQMYDVAKIKANQFAVSAQSAEAKAGAARLIAELDMKKNEMMGNMQMALMQHKALAQAAGGGGIPNPAILAPEQQKLAVKMPDGNYRLASSDEGAKEINKKQIAASDINHTIAEMKGLMSWSVPGTDRHAMAEALKNELSFKLQTFHGLSRLSAEDQDLLSTLTTNVTSMRQDKAEKLIKQLQSGVNSATQLTYKQYIPGYQPVKEKEPNAAE